MFDTLIFYLDHKIHGELSCSFTFMNLASSLKSFKRKIVLRPADPGYIYIYIYIYIYMYCCLKGDRI